MSGQSNTTLDLRVAAAQKEYSKILQMTYGLPSEAYKDRPSLYFFVPKQQPGNSNTQVMTMWGSSPTEALNRLIFTTKAPKDAFQQIPMSPPFPEGMNGWELEFSLFSQDKSFQTILGNWASKVAKKYKVGEQTDS